MIHHVDQKTIDLMYRSYSPIFILSTGRSGSKFLTSLLNLSNNIKAFHEPKPSLQYFSDFAFHNQEEKVILTKMIDAARMELILDIFIKEKIFVESNQCLTFFAPAIRDLFEKSKFVHLVRHPGDFVRSGVRKGWHRNDTIWESGRVQMKNKLEWNVMDQIERLVWVWQVTTDFIEKFKKTIEADRIITFRIEDLFNKTRYADHLLNFVGANKIPAEKIQEIQNTKINELRIFQNETPNMKKISNFPKYENWDNNIKKKVKRYTEAQAKLFGYRL
jgi:hypothetical protein